MQKLQSQMLMIHQLLSNPQKFGLDDDDIKRIKALSINDLNYLSKCKVEFFTFDFDKGKFQRALQVSETIKTEQRMVVEYIKHGASAPMMRALFGHTAMEVKTLREDLGLSEKGGRPTSPSKQEQMQILEAWSKTYMMDEREHYLKVSQETGISLRTIWNQVNSYEAQEVVQAEPLRSKHNPRMKKVCNH